ncbi:selenocysteine protein [Candidatus Aerophobetes bacterium]|uniref:Selenocysteine protein n=1 Tax=Aerophobetes bacterium TaxID=2030807 RepID=A0A662D6T6_UNCAE|nr:MAG: selenocysteine protein [Candidatus Aerophobetes bacterium]
MPGLPDTLEHALTITVFVFVMMILIDYINVLTQGRMSSGIKGGIWRQYLIASFLGATPGCLGAFMNASLYLRGLLSFGAIVGGMIATSGDEAYIMLTLFPRIAFLLFFLLFVFGIVFAWVSDKATAVFHIQLQQECELSHLHTDEECRCFDLKAVKKLPKMSLLRLLLLIILSSFLGIFGANFLKLEQNWMRITFITLVSLATFITITAPDHYLKEHIWVHIVKKHLWRVFLWTFFSLLFINIALFYWNLEEFCKGNTLWMLLMGGLIGLIPESGPHLIFVMMYARGLIPFSVFFTSCFVQDGHGMLPLFSYTVKDSLLIKMFNLLFGLGVGVVFFLLGW